MPRSIELRRRILVARGIETEMKSTPRPKAPTRQITPWELVKTNHMRLVEMQVGRPIEIILRWNMPVRELAKFLARHGATVNYSTLHKWKEYFDIKPWPTG